MKRFQNRRNDDDDWRNDKVIRSIIVAASLICAALCAVYVALVLYVLSWLFS